MTVKFPCLVDNGSEYESPENVENTEQRMRIHARNLLRHIFRSEKLVSEDGASYQQSKLAHSEVINSLFTKMEPELKKALFIEMQQMLDNASAAQQNLKDEDKALKEQFNYFHNYVLSIYPFFLDPYDQEMMSKPITISTNVDGLWQPVSYKIRKIDISPRVGPLAFLLEDEDRIFAYALESDTAGANNHLLLMGTTFPGGQGKEFADLYNLKPGFSIGEGHSFTAIGSWLADQQKKNVIVSGHSKGATMSVLTALKFPEKIKSAFCLNPAGLHQNTIDEHKEAWQQLSNKPNVEILFNEGDIVPHFDAGFMDDMHVVKVKPHQAPQSVNVGFDWLPEFVVRQLHKIGMIQEAHVHHFTAHEQVTFEPMSINDLNNAPNRVYFDSIRQSVSFFAYPAEYSRLVTKLAVRKLDRYIDAHQLEFAIGLVSSALIASAYTAMFLGSIPTAGVAGVATLSAGLLAKLCLPSIINVTSQVICISATLTGILTGLAIGTVRANIPQFNEDNTAEADTDAPALL